MSGEDTVGLEQREGVLPSIKMKQNERFGPNFLFQRVQWIKDAFYSLII